MLLLVYSLLIIVLSKVHSNCDFNSKWMRELTLGKNGKMVIKWNFTDDDITMMMMAQSKGWLLLGFGSRSVSLVDAALGWVENNKTYLQDMFIDNTTTQPILDENQSLQLISGGETGNSTFICFTRKLKSCDDQDHRIVEGTTDVIWSFDDFDPIDGKITIKLTKNKFKYINLLNVVYPKPSSDVYTIQGPNITMSSKQGSTVYWCSYHKIPPMTDQYYIVGFEPVIPKQSIKYVHHIALYSCNNEEMSKLYNRINSQGYNCQSTNNSQFYTHCKIFQAAWAVGVEDQYFPPSSGLPFGKANTTSYYRLDIHYDMTEYKGEFIDNSGFILSIIKEKPENIMGILITGYQITPLMVVPPGQENFSVFAACSPKCLQQNIPKEGITVTGVFYHAHKLARKMKVHLFRDQTELKPLVEDNFYFHVQGFRLLKKEMKVLQNDTIGLECIYDTSAMNRTTVSIRNSRM